MTRPLRLVLVASTLGAMLAIASPASHAADVTRMDILSLFELQQIDKNHDSQVSKKEFMDMMSKAWDMEMAGKAKKDSMTLADYKTFAAMFNLNVGN